jgi:hypothetical protein
LEAPSTKHQITNKSQAPNAKQNLKDQIQDRRMGRGGFWLLEFWVWRLFGIWCLGFGVWCGLRIGSTKSQAPNHKQIPRTKFKNGELDAAGFGYWSFGFGDCLGFGAWDLEFGARR